MEQGSKYNKETFGSVPDSRRTAIAYSILDDAKALLDEARGTIEKALQGKATKETAFQNYARSSIKLTEVAVSLVEFESWVRDDLEVLF